MFRGETMEVLPPAVGEVSVGSDRPLGFTVRNYGGPAHYRLTATVGGQVLTRIEPPAVDLAPDAEQRVVVWLPAQTIATAGTRLELLLVASSEDPDQSSTNSAILRLDIVKH
jgi:hypothetical protein